MATAATSPVRGGEIFERLIEPALPSDLPTGYAAIDLMTEDYEISADLGDAVSRLRRRRPEAKIYFRHFDTTPCERLGWRATFPAMSMPDSKRWSQFAFVTNPH